MVENYNSILKNKNSNIPELDDKKIKWSEKLKRMYKKGEKIKLDQNNVVLEMYRPFTKKWLFYDRQVIERPGKLYSKWGSQNLALITTGRGLRNDFSTFVTNKIPCMDLWEKAQVFLQYDNSCSEQLFSNNINVNQLFVDRIGLSPEDTFAYIYGLLNSKEYQTRYVNNLKKDLPHIPIVKNKEKYVEIGKKLMNLHLNYEKVPVFENVNIEFKNNPSYKVEKMKFAKIKNTETGKSEDDRSVIIFNTDITIKNIPEKAYKYIVNGRSAIEWIMDQYRIKKDSKSGIIDDPNDFSDDPKYIFNLLLRIINVSVQTVDLINSLPKLEIIE